MKKSISFLMTVLFISVLSCKKDVKKEETVTQQPASVATTGKLQVQFENLVDTFPLVFGQKYVDPKGDTIKITRFNYFISNIVFTASDNSTFADPNSHHLIRHSNPATTTITVPGVPFKSYTSISFILGVDSASNNSGAQAGDLDPGASSDMYWSWSAGYIMLKLEGSSPVSGAPDKSLEYHIGGYGGIYKTQRAFTFNFPASAGVSSSVTPLIHLGVNANEFFKTPNLVDVTTQFSQVAAGPGAKSFADNYADMITFKHVHN